MKKRFALVFVASLTAFTSLAEASTITVQFNNMSGKAVSAIYATPKGEATPSEVNLVQSSEIAASAMQETTIASADSQCVYDLKIQFGDGSSLERPDVDLCQTDELIIE